MIRFIVRREQRRKYFLSVILLTVLTVYTLNNRRQASLGNPDEQRMNGFETEPRKTMHRNTTHIILLYWSKVFGKPVDINRTNRLPYFYVGERCKPKCELIINRSRAMEANAIIIHARDSNPFPSPEKYSHIPLILHTNENPAYTDLLRNPLFLSHFKYLISYRLDADFPMPTFAKPDLTLPVPFKEKTGVVFAAFSNCETVRTSYLGQLMKYIPVDSYGACLNNKIGLPKRYETDFKQKKIEMARLYKFTLVFMNADCDYFVDDQLTHALSAGSIPVFMGTDKVDSFLPGNLKSAVIKVKDFKTPEELAKYLTFLSSNELEYNKYLTWKREGFRFPANYRSTPIGQFWESPDTIYCTICQRLTQSSFTKQSTLKPDICRKRAKKEWYLE